MATIDDKTRKRSRRRGSSGSISSGETEPSKPPTDVLGLGEYLAHELDFADNYDVLGCWMAHHVAELINAARNEPAPAERAEARRNAEETILRIWEHRHTLPGKAHPLRRYDGVLSALHRLRPDGHLFEPPRFNDTRGDRERLAFGLLDDAARLLIALLLDRLPPGTGVDRTPAEVVTALDQEEQGTLAVLQGWQRLFESEFGSRSPRRSEHGAPEREGDVRAEAVRLIESAMKKLQALQASLADATP